MWRALPFFLGLLSCSDELDRDIEGKVRIQQGVYGQTSYIDDAGKAKAESIELHLLRGDARILDFESDASGFYQVALDAGTYKLCTFLHVCTDLSIEVGKLVRKDHERGPHRGWH